MKNKLYVLLLVSFVWFLSIYNANAQDTTTNLKPLNVSSDKLASKSVWFPEELGEDLSRLTTANLLSSLIFSKDKIELRKVAKVLGDREIAGTLKLSDAEQAVIDTKVREYIKSLTDFYNVDYIEVHNQIIRLWHLADFELLRNIENPNPEIQGFIFNTLIEMRNERIINILVDKAKACQKPALKEMYLGTFRILNQDFEFNVPDRKCMDAQKTEEVFNRVVAPALKELSPETVKAGKN